MKALKGCHSQRSQRVSTKTLWDIKRPLKALLALPVMTMTKLLYGLVIVELLGGLSFAHRNPEPCPSIEYVDYNAHRIPTRITGLYCLTQRIIGMSCRHDSKVIIEIYLFIQLSSQCIWCFLQKCFQLTANMDVGYIEKNEDDVEIVVMRRNITVGLGCGCLEKRIRRYQQTGNIAIDL